MMIIIYLFHLIKDFELYVINLPQDLTEDQIKELLNTALISIEANEKKGEPITKVTKPKNGKFFILEFRTRREIIIKIII